MYMSKDFLSGEDALLAMQEDGGSPDNEFSKFTAGTQYYVKVLGTADLARFFSYGIYKVTNSFVAKDPSVKDNGFPVDNLTPWDEAYLHLRREDEEYNSKANQEAYKYRAKERFMIGFYDVEEADFIVIDVSKNQAQTIYSSIAKNKDRLDDVVFKLEKIGGAKPSDTRVALTVEDNVVNIQKMIDADIEPDTNLTDAMIKNFKEAPEEFDKTRFEGCLFEADEEQMLQNLHGAGFDVTSIGYEVPDMTDKEEDKEEGASEADGEGLDINSKDFPF